MRHIGKRLQITDQTGDPLGLTVRQVGRLKTQGVVFIFCHVFLVCCRGVRLIRRYQGKPKLFTELCLNKVNNLLFIQCTNPSAYLITPIVSG